MIVHVLTNKSYFSTKIRNHLIAGHFRMRRMSMYNSITWKLIVVVVNI